MSHILNLLSDHIPMSWPEIAIHFSRPERTGLQADLERLITEGQIIHSRRAVDGVTISQFKLPEGSHKQLTIFDIEGAH